MSTGSTLCGLEAGEVFLLLLLVSLVVPALLQLGSGEVLGEVGKCCCCPSYTPLGCDVGTAP